MGHDARELKPERTLQKLYLDPLHERVKANGGRDLVDDRLQAGTEALVTSAVLEVTQ
mgnify:CR=1 FL=1